ncbi:hypothetical protein [Rubinisphaera italica]|uniref:Uncharacterized protein n=1 Tax=Rubinisphaera italica TaxID=2527969 RepID=A0A5C5XFY6_9PLAN|nr:hypothetical protein [Rubinisphaera italica]TWT61734.1 hypothetical protein Pan54_24710 [Rubinisphaera italica]
MTSESSSRSRSGKDDQGRPFADSGTYEQFDRNTTELVIDYGHLIDTQGSHELPTFYDTETFESIDYKSNAITTNRFSLTNGVRNSQSQNERTTSSGYSITKEGTGRNRAFEIVFMNTDDQVGLDIAFGSYNQSSAFWLIKEETRNNNGRVDHHSKEDSSFNQTSRNYIHKFTQLLSSSPGTYVNSVSGTKTRTLTSYLDKDAYLSNYTGGQNQIHLKDGYQVGSKDDVIYQMKQVDDPGSAGGPNIVTLLPTTTVDTEYSFGGDFDGSGSIDAGGTVNWTSVTSESRSNGNVTPGNSDWDASLTLEDYLGSGFGGTFAYIPVDASQDLIQLWQNDFQAPILDGLQQVDPHTPAHAGGHSNDTQFVTEQSNGNHNTNYQLNGAYQNLDPNTTIDFETPWGLLSGLKNTEETSSSEPASEPAEGEGTEGDGCDCACEGSEGTAGSVEDLTLGIFIALDDEGNQVGWILATILTDEDGNPNLDDDQDYLPDEILQITDMEGNQKDDLDYSETDLHDFTTFGEVYGITKPQFEQVVAQLKADYLARKERNKNYQIIPIKDKIDSNSNKNGSLEVNLNPINPWLYPIYFDPHNDPNFMAEPTQYHYIAGGIYWRLGFKGIADGVTHVGDRLELWATDPLTAFYYSTGFGGLDQATEFANGWEDVPAYEKLDTGIQTGLAVVTGTVGPKLSKLSKIVNKTENINECATPRSGVPNRPPKTVYHQGDLADGVSPRRPLSTSPDTDLGHYHPDGDLYRFDIPADVYDQWILERSIQPFNDLHLPSGQIRPEIRIMPPASGRMNEFLVPRTGR